MKHASESIPLGLWLVLDLGSILHSRSSSGADIHGGVHRLLSDRQTHSNVISEMLVAELRPCLVPSHLPLFTPLPQAPHLGPTDGPQQVAN